MWSGTKDTSTQVKKAAVHDAALIKHKTTEAAATHFSARDLVRYAVFNLGPA